MSLDQIIAFALFFLLFLLPLIGDFFKKKKNNPLPKSQEDFERRYEVRLEEKKRSHQHLKPPPAQPPKLEPLKAKLPKMEPSTMEPSTMDLNGSNGKRSLSRSYKPGYGLESEIEERELSTKVKERHIESEIESLGFSSLLQDRFSTDIQAAMKKSSRVKRLLKKGDIKNAIILSEIIKRRY